MASSIDELEEALVAFAVDAGDPVRRRKRAVQLAAEGMTPAQIELLGEHCEGTVDGEHAAVRVLCALLADPERRRQRLDDLGRAAEAREARRRGDEPNADGRRAPSNEELDQRFAFARVVCDGAKPFQVANELGIATDEVLRLVELERARRGDVQGAKPLHIPPDPHRRRQEIQAEIASWRNAPKGGKADTLIANLRAARDAREPVLTEARRHGKLNLRRILGSPSLRGALAMLEDEGLVMATSTVGDDGFASVVAPLKPEDQTKLREQRRAWFVREIQDGTTAAARAAALRAAAHAGGAAQ